jgi:hypothetical protein
MVSRSRKLERGGDAGESVIRSAREATVVVAAVGAVHLKGLPMVKETLV